MSGLLSLSRGICYAKNGGMANLGGSAQGRQSSGRGGKGGERSLKVHAIAGCGVGRRGYREFTEIAMGSGGKHGSPLDVALVIGEKKGGDRCFANADGGCLGG